MSPSASRSARLRDAEDELAIRARVGRLLEERQEVGRRAAAMTKTIKQTKNIDSICCFLVIKPMCSSSGGKSERGLLPTSKTLVDECAMDVVERMYITS